jgi:hypothetical protein
VAVKQPTLVGIADDAAPTPAKRKGDHKRKARPIAPATVTVRDGEIIVVVPDVLGKNEAHKQGRGGARIISAATKRYRESVMAGFRAFPIGDPGYLNLFANAGAWRLEVVGAWPRQRDEIKMWPCDVARCPVGDADAAIPQALDALQHAGILDDDARIVEVRAWNLYRKGERWTVIRLVRVPDLAERDAAIAHLVAMLPPPSAVAPVASKRRKR